MTATYTAHHLLARADRKLVHFDPNATTATLVPLDRAGSANCVPIAQFRRFLAGIAHSVGTGNVTSAKIIAATAADGTGNTAVVAHALGTQPDAVGDTIWLECDVDQIREVLPTATHVGVEIALATSTDECWVSFASEEPYFPHANLTADQIA